MAESMRCFPAHSSQSAVSSLTMILNIPAVYHVDALW